MMKAKENTIENLKTTNEELKIKIGDQADKMQQMDKASLGKDKEIETFTFACLRSISSLFVCSFYQCFNLLIFPKACLVHLLHLVCLVTYFYFQFFMELSEVKEDLKEIRIADEEQASLFATYLKDADEKQEQRHKQLHDRMQEQHAEMLLNSFFCSLFAV
jgi:hypothetical protein